MLETRKLLIVSYVFPPYGGITVQRALSFAKYLPQEGIEVHVLTASNAAGPVRDPALLRHIPQGVAVHRTPTLEPPFYLRKKVWDLLRRERKPDAGIASEGLPAGPGGMTAAIRKSVKRILMPDPQVLWKPLAIRAACRIIKRHRIDTVLVTAPPFSVFLIGNAIKRRFPEIRLVSDFRDEWLRFYLTDFDFLNDAETRRRAEQIELETIESSDLVLAVTASSLNEIRGRYAAQPDSKFAVLPNGYDPEALHAAGPHSHGLPGKVVVTHIGTAYRTASPSYYLDALDNLPESIRSRFESRFIGRISETEAEVLKNRKSDVRLLGFLPQEQALRYAGESDYLLLTMTNGFSLPGKLFEYLATGIPVLALSPSGGEVDRLLACTHGGWCVPHDDPQSISRLLMKAAERIDGNPPGFEPDWEAIRAYERPRLARRLAGILRGSISSSV